MRDLGVFTTTSDGVMLWWERVGCGEPLDERETTEELRDDHVMASAEVTIDECDR